MSTKYNYDVPHGQLPTRIDPHNQIAQDYLTLPVVDVQLDTGPMAPLQIIINAVLLTAHHADIVLTLQAFRMYKHSNRL